jgi:hypothetical protein
MRADRHEILQAAEDHGFKAVRLRDGRVIRGAWDWHTAVLRGDSHTVRYLQHVVEVRTRHEPATNRCVVSVETPEHRVGAGYEPYNPRFDRSQPLDPQPSVLERDTFARALRDAQRHGLTLDETQFVVRWYDDEPGVSLGYVDASTQPVTLALMRGRTLDALYHTSLHELQHVSDAISGMWHRLTRSQRESRARTFADAVCERELRDWL